MVLLRFSSRRVLAAAAVGWAGLVLGGCDASEAKVATVEQALAAPATSSAAEDGSLMSLGPRDTRPELWRGLFPTPDGLPVTSKSFCQAKSKAMSVHARHGKTFYCGCRFHTDMTLDKTSCGYELRDENHRAHRMEWEHIVTVEQLIEHRPCFKQKPCTGPDGEAYGGAKCCDESDELYIKMVSDLQNLVPSVGELNGVRANLPFGEVPGERREFGACDFEVDEKRTVVEPAAHLRGDIARAYLYMHYVYGAQAVPLTDAQLRQFEQWHAEDPPTDEERERNRAIARFQGAGNPLVERVVFEDAHRMAAAQGSDCGACGSR